MGDSQHSQKENSQAEKISLRVFLSQWGVSGEGATEIDNLQSETSNSEKLPLPAGEGWGEGSTFNSATVKQLQEVNNETSTVESIAGAQVCAPYSDIQAETSAQDPLYQRERAWVRG